MDRLSVVSLNKNILWSRDVNLRQECRPIDIDNPEDLSFAQQLIQEMFRTLFVDPSGVALAAPQVGVQVQITVISYEDKDTKTDHLLALINPQITPESQETDNADEICLSIPNCSGQVARFRSISVRAFDQHGKSIEFKANNWFARVIQHEVDHLHGIVYIDKMKGKLKNVPDFPERRIGPVIKKLGLKSGD